jgi:hypothetical protein
MKDEDLEKNLKETQASRGGWLQWALAGLAAGAAALCVAEWLKRRKEAPGKPRR